MNEAEARELLARSRREPRAVVEEWDPSVQLAGGDPRVEAIALRAIAVATLITEGATESATHARSALSAARRSGDDSLTVEVMLTLAGSLAFGGENEEAFDLLEDARRIAEGNQKAEVLFQIGTLKARLGLSDEARSLFSSALPVFAQNGDEESIAMTLHNRGMINLYAGDLDQALDDFVRAREIETRLGLGPAVAAVEHNIGVATALKGDLPAALEMLDESEAKHLEFAESPAEVQVSRVEVLLSAGLFHEAERLAERLTAELASAGLEEDRAEATLAWAMAARLSGDPSKAESLASEAREMFNNQTREAWALNAEQVILGARLDDGKASMVDFEDARQAADRLEEADQSEAAFGARLTAGLIALACGERNEAISELRSVSAQVGGTVQRRLSSALAGSLVLELEGDPAGASTRARRGLELLEDYQTVLGASDVRAGVEKHASRLGDLGLRLAGASGNPMQVLDWMERTRSRAMRTRPARTDADAPYATDLTSLRHVQFALRTASGREAVELAARKEALELAIRDKSRYRDRTSLSWSTQSAEQIVAALADTTLVEFAVTDGVLWRVVASSDHIGARPIATLDEVTREIEWHRFAMRRLARGRGDQSQAEAAAGTLDEMLIGDVELGSTKVLVVPVPSMYAFSWSSLPSLHDRDLTLAPSAGHWWARASGASARIEKTALVVGPDLTTGVDEVRDVARIYGHEEWTAELTTVSEAIAALDGADVAHVASHGSFERDNPLFSALRLADGDMHVYDVEQLSRPPGLIVLSACDSGFSTSHPGEELLGLTSALLGMGSRTVVASVGLVPDTEETRSVMVALHGRLNEGKPVSLALSEATRDLPDDDPRAYAAGRSFLCIGAG